MRSESRAVLYRIKPCATRRRQRPPRLFTSLKWCGTVELRPEAVVIASDRMASEPSVLPRALSLAVHELRRPITVGAGYLRMLLREQAPPITGKQRKMLEEAD